jgi:hypothetical protein
MNSGIYCENTRHEYPLNKTNRKQCLDFEMCPHMQCILEWKSIWRSCWQLLIRYKKFSSDIIHIRCRYNNGHTKIELMTISFSDWPHFMGIFKNINDPPCNIHLKCNTYFTCKLLTTCLNNNKCITFKLKWWPYVCIKKHPLFLDWKCWRSLHMITNVGAILRVIPECKMEDS